MRALLSFHILNSEKLYLKTIDIQGSLSINTKAQKLNRNIIAYLILDNSSFIVVLLRIYLMNL